MSFEVLVYRRTPDGPKSFKVDLDDPEVDSVELAPDWWLYRDRRCIPPRWYVGRPAYRRRPDVEAEKADGKVYAEVPGRGGIEVLAFTPEAWRNRWTRIHEVISEEEAQTRAQHFLGAKLSDLFPAMAKPKPARPGPLSELAAVLWDEGPKSRNVPEFLKLIEERFVQSDPPASEVEIPFEDIIKRCHAGYDADVDTIRKNTLDPTKKAIRDAHLPYRWRTDWVHRIVTITRLSD
jgi:hypothetical protein